MAYPLFDRSRLHIRPLAERVHDMTVADVLPLDYPGEPFGEGEIASSQSALLAMTRDETGIASSQSALLAMTGDERAARLAMMPLGQVAERIRRARAGGKPVILMMGAHVIKSGLSRFVIDLMERGIITHIGVNGAGPIHDFELALAGGTTESVARYISEGQFGLWQETGRINDIVAAGLRDGLGYGEALGREITEGYYPHRDISVLAAGYRLRVPVTVHIGIGQDIIHEHSNCDGAALGEASYRDFLVFTQAVTALEGGVMLNYGTAVMGPEVYLKALAMARNVAHQEGRHIAHFTTAVFDLLDLGEDLDHEAPKTDARYYYRPYKTILVRTVQDGGESFYIRGAHRATLPALYRMVTGP